MFNRAALAIALLTIGTSLGASTCAAWASPQSSTSPSAYLLAQIQQPKKFAQVCLQRGSQCVHDDDCCSKRCLQESNSDKTFRCQP